MATTTDERLLIVNADDFGSSEGVNNGIREAHQAGVVTSTSLLANSPAFDHAVAIAHAADGTLGIGVHLNFVEGRPLTGARTLVDARTGHFLPLAALALRVLLGRVDPQEVRAEAAAQIQRVRHAGLAITHVDGHRHAHLLPIVWNSVADAASSEGIGVMRLPVERFEGADMSSVLKIVALRAAARRATIARPSPRSTDNFIGLSLQGRHHFGTLLLRALDALRSGTTELMVHPGRADARLGAFDSYHWPRESELRALLSVPIRNRLRRGDIRLTTFAALA